MVAARWRSARYGLWSHRSGRRLARRTPDPSIWRRRLRSLLAVRYPRSAPPTYRHFGDGSTRVEGEYSGAVPECSTPNSRVVSSDDSPALLNRWLARFMHRRDTCSPCAAVSRQRAAELRHCMGMPRAALCSCTAQLYSVAARLHGVDLPWPYIASETQLPGSALGSARAKAAAIRSR
jgi:hypothetical protein